MNVPIDIESEAKIKKNEWQVKVEVIEKINDNVTIKSTLANNYEGEINNNDGFAEDTMAMLLKQFRNSIEHHMQYYINNKETNKENE